jgi:tetratricopeptide (TPR) repeat protein
MAIATMNRKQRRAEQPRGNAVPDMRAAERTVQALFIAGLQYHKAGRLNEAERGYRQVLMLNPRHADSLHLLGVIANQKGDHGLAIRQISEAISIVATEASYHSNLGTALWKQGRLNAAIACYRRALELKPDYPTAHFNLGTVLWKQGRPAEADVCYRAAIHFRPDYPEAYDNLGTLFKEQGRPEEAISCYRQAIALRPEYPEAHNNLGTALLEQGRTDEAVACYHDALKLKPDYADGHFNLGNAVWELGQTDAAVGCYRNALALRPDHADAYHNLGVALKELGRLEEAIACYREVLALDPDHPEAHSNLGIALLAAGDMATGWTEHEWRWKTPQMMNARRDFPQPGWRGEPANGRTLLIHAEQGFGDTIQFCRYGSLAAACGARVILEVQKPLVRLLRGLDGVDLVIGRGDELPSFDLHCPMLSMPMAFGTTVSTIPAASAYLRADATQVAIWRKRLATMARPGSRIGLAWAGNPRIHSRALTAVDRRRSVSPDRLAPLFGLHDVQFFSLQKDGPKAPTKFPLIDVMDEMDDFADTAALIANLDLVISVDTAIAHLAAALGKPVWLLDRFDACWRWLVGRRDSPWYPGLRLYRQPRPGDWDAVLAEVVRDLYRLVETQPAVDIRRCDPVGTERSGPLRQSPVRDLAGRT